MTLGYSSIVKGANKYIHRAEYSAINKNKLLIYTATWLNLIDTMLSKKNHT